MKDIRLNNTPVRTSVNFGINDILVKNLEIPQSLNKFDNFSVENSSKNIQVITDATFDENKFVYGIGEEIEDLEKNSKIDIILDEAEEKENAKINFELGERNSSLSSSIRINAKENSNGIVVLRYGALGEKECFASTKLKIKSQEKSNLQVVIVNMLNDSSTNCLAIESDLEQEALLNVVIIDFGGKTSISNYYSNLEGKSCISTIDSIYLGDKERLIDINYIAHLKGEKTDVNIEVQGALKDNAKKNFKGTIDFKTGCKQSKGNENEFCMLLSPTAKSKALPMLLCTEDDVEGNHSTASGKVDKAELFYLMSRGISQNEAMKLIVRAKFTPIIEKIEDEEIRREIINQIDLKLD